jgi:hypothetical protein
MIESLIIANLFAIAILQLMSLMSMKEQRITILNSYTLSTVGIVLSCIFLSTSIHINLNSIPSDMQIIIFSLTAFVVCKLLTLQKIFYNIPLCKRIARYYKNKHLKLL